MNLSSQAATLQVKPVEIDSHKALSQESKLHAFAKQCIASIKWILRGVRIQPTRKTLRLCENLPLGDKRFVAVIQVESERFLIGGAAGSVSLLTRLQEKTSFSDSLQNKLMDEVAR
jgi:hypothetical protein